MLCRRLSFERAKRPLTGSTLSRSQSTVHREALPIVTGVAVSEAFNGSATCVQATLMTFPRFLHSRALKSRRRPHQRLNCSFIYRPSSQGQSLSTSGSDLTFLTTDSEKDCSAAILRNSDCEREGGGRNALGTADAQLERWAKTRSSHQIQSLQSKQKRLKVIVSLPGPQRSFARYVSSLRYSTDDLHPFNSQTAGNGAKSQLKRSQTIKNGFQKLKLK